jgi:hypothetical protein
MNADRLLDEVAARVGGPPVDARRLEGLARWLPGVAADLDLVAYRPEVRASGSPGSRPAVSPTCMDTAAGASPTC